MDFHDALVEGRSVTVRIVDWHAFAIAFGKLGDDQARLSYGVGGAAEWLRRTGEVLPGVEVKEEGE